MARRPTTRRRSTRRVRGRGSNQRTRRNYGSTRRRSTRRAASSRGARTQTIRVVIEQPSPVAQQVATGEGTGYAVPKRPRKARF